MTNPFDRSLWPLSEVAIELDDLATSLGDPPGSDADLEPGAEWACRQISTGVAPREICEAALWLGLRRARTEGRGVHGLVSHSVLAAHSCATLGSSRHEVDRRTGALAAVQHVAYTVGASRGGINDDREGPTLLGWIESTDPHADAIGEFTEAALHGEVELADHRWMSAAISDPEAAEEALISAGAAGYHLNEHKLVYPAQLRSWIGRGELDPVLFRAAARYVGNHVQDPKGARSTRSAAAALALDAVQRSPGTLGRLATAGHERISTVASGIGLTARSELAPLVLASLEEGLSPEDLADAISLANAAAFASTSFGDQAPIGPVHACTGADAVQLCLARAQSPELRYELALCATQGPSAADLDPITELWVPPFDDGGLEDLIIAVAEGDPDAAADAATAVPPDDPVSVDAAWSAVRAAAATDQWMVLHAIKHVVAMERCFRASDHPARVWFLAAAARTAAHATAVDQPVALLVADILG